MEAIDVLYRANILNFKAASGVLRFKSLLHEPNWNRIRRMSLSTVFLVPKKLSMSLFGPGLGIPPENYDAWRNACSTISTLQNLQRIDFDMTVWNYHNHKSTNTVEDADLLCILEPLNDINARVFEVELNVEPPDSVRRAINPMSFNITVCHRPYDSKTFRKG